MVKLKGLRITQSIVKLTSIPRYYILWELTYASSAIAVVAFSTLAALTLLSEALPTLAVSSRTVTINILITTWM